MSKELITRCDFCDLSIPHTRFVCHYNGFPGVTITTGLNDPRLVNEGYMLSVSDSCFLEFRFELQVDNGTRFPLLLGQTDIIKPCVLVVVKDGVVYGTDHVELLPGDIVLVETDEDRKYGSLIFPTIGKTSKQVSPLFSSETHQYTMSIKTGEGLEYSILGH